VTIGDVCGKGAEAAAVTGVARSVLRLLAGQGRDVSDSLLDLNRTLRDAVVPGTPGRFCTAAVVRLDVGDGSGSATGRFALSLRLAGHPPPVRLTAGGEATLVGTPGTLLGILDDAQVAFPETVVELGPGDAMVLYTDGVVEARRGGVMLGDTGLLDVARGCAGLSAQGIADRVRAAADRFSGGAPRDDIAVLVLRVPSVSTGATTRAEDHAGAPSVTLESPWNS
jgi:serine phosphatase RsbU (regulator of sigma subunit)